MSLFSSDVTVNRLIPPARTPLRVNNTTRFNIHVIGADVQHFAGVTPSTMNLQRTIDRRKRISSSTAWLHDPHTETSSAGRRSIHIRASLHPSRTSWAAPSLYPPKTAPSFFHLIKGERRHRRRFRLAVRPVHGVKQAGFPIPEHTLPIETDRYGEYHAIHIHWRMPILDHCESTSPHPTIEYRGEPGHVILRQRFAE
jgi:hypothetical protein